MDDQADVIVLGMGPGGEEVAGRLAEAGLDVIGVEPDLVGGECPYWGCIPTKMMVRASDALAEAGRASGLAGVTVDGSDWACVVDRVREATDDWNDGEAVRRFEGKGGRLMRGHGRADGPGRVVVDGVTLEATRAVVIATGGRPSIPPIPGLADTPYWTNRDAVRAGLVPGSLVILGGGAVGVELAQVFRRFGAEVVIVDTASRLVAQEEPEAATLLASVLESDGIGVRLSAEVASVYHDGERFTLVLSDSEVLAADHLLVATGRHADLAALDLATVGLDESASAVSVDDHLRVTGVDRTWAVGDVTGKGAFTHMAMYQANIAVRDILSEPLTPADYRAVPRVTFTDPEIASVGLTERTARDAGFKVRVGSSDLAASARGWIHGEAGHGLIKVVADTDRGFLVGATSMGPCGGEVLGMLTLAVHACIPIRQLTDMIYAYPTFHGAVQDALRDLEFS